MKRINRFSHEYTPLVALSTNGTIFSMTEFFSSSYFARVILIVTFAQKTPTFMSLSKECNTYHLSHKKQYPQQHIYAADLHGF